MQYEVCKEWKENKKVFYYNSDTKYSMSNLKYFLLKTFIKGIYLTKTEKTLYFLSQWNKNRKNIFWVILRTYNALISLYLLKMSKFLLSCT